jgi:hypothetical protein
MTTDRPCPVCRAPTVTEPGPGADASVGSVAGLASELPRGRCPAGHVSLATSSPQVVDAALAQLRRAFPYGRSRRLRRDETCAACGAVLTMPVRRTDWPVTFDRPSGLDLVVSVRFDVPATRCPACGTDHVPARSQQDLEEVLRALLTN